MSITLLQYQVNDLKELCAAEIKRRLCTESLAEGLILGDRYGDAELKATAIELICTGSGVMDTIGWKTNMPNHPKLLDEVCRALMNKLEKESG